MNISESLISFRNVDERLEKFRTGDIALSSLDDLSGMFIFAFTQSLVEHSAIICWASREKYEKNNVIEFKARNEGDDLLMFVHITKRKMFDFYTGTRRSGLVLCSLDEFCKKHLTTIWIRKLNRLIDDKTALGCFENYLSDNHLLLEYENDIRTILGLPFKIIYRPYSHRMVCTTMVCDYLNTSYGYPFLISDKGIPFDSKEQDLEKREVNFKLTEREFDVYRAVDFCKKYNESPVFEDEEEEVVYGKSINTDFALFHPMNVLFITTLLFFILIIVFAFLLFKFLRFGRIV